MLRPNNSGELIGFVLSINLRRWFYNSTSRSSCAMISIFFSLPSRIVSIPNDSYVLMAFLIVSREHA
jgi:hypothetical protein